MRELLPALDAWRADGRRVGRAVVIRTFGSAPRAEGAVLLVAEDGRMMGSVSGGCVEGAAAEAVLEARRTGHSRVIRYGISDAQAWDVGLACGGTIDVLVQPEIPAAAVDAARTLGRAVVTPLPGDLPPGDPRPAPPTMDVALEPPIVIGTQDPRDRERPDGLSEPIRAAAAEALHAGLSTTTVDDTGSWFIEAFPRPPRLIVVGATELSRHLVALARPLGYETFVVDPRAAFATEERFPDVGGLLVAWPEEAFERLGLGPDDAVAVVSHDPKVDEPAIVEAFRRGARYVGAVGSRRSQADRRDRLIAAGLSGAQLASLRGPIGLDLGGREPVETALAILAEIVALRRGGTGRPLVERSGPITSGG